jgi:hypothetical protein
MPIAHLGHSTRHESSNTLIVKEMHDSPMKKVVKDSMHLDHHNVVTTPKRFVDSIPAHVSPDCGSSLGSGSVGDSTESEDNGKSMVIKTQHKLLEDSGFPYEEPLLKDNPHRFVIFPIQDNEVRIQSCIYTLSSYD